MPRIKKSVSSKPDNNPARVAGPGTFTSRDPATYCYAILIIGAVLRLREYSADRSLWLDETMLTMNVVKRSYSGLLQPLAERQAAPIGWLWAEKTTMVLFGKSEWALRAFPLLISLATLILFWKVARRWLNGPGQIIACALFACSPDLIRYAVEIKQYGSDVFFLLLVIWAATRVVEHPTAANISTWTVIGVLATWSSHAAILSVATSGLIIAAALRHRRISGRYIAGSGFILLVSLTTEYFATLRGLSRNTALATYWHDGIAPHPYRIRSFAAWLARVVIHLMQNPLRFWLPQLALLIVGFGAYALHRTHRLSALLVITPLVAAILAAATGRYPMRERLALYLVPLVFITIGAAAQYATRQQRMFCVAVITIIAICLAPNSRGFAVLWHPIDITDSRGPYAFVARGYRVGDAVLYESPYAEESYRYYGIRYHLPLTGRFSFGRTPNPCNHGPDVAPLARYRRVWLIFTHLGTTEPTNRAAIYASQFTSYGTIQRRFGGTGNAAAYLIIQRSRTSPHGPGSMRSWQPNTCLQIKLER